MKYILRSTLPVVFILLLGCSASNEPLPEDPSPSDPTSEDTTPGADETVPGDENVDDDSVPDNPSPDEDPWDSLTTFIEEQRVNSNIPGLAVAITRPGDVLWTQAFGMANLETALPVTTNTPFMLASVSKTVTAVAVMRAELENHLRLDEPIDPYLSFSVDNPLTDAEVIKVSHLVSHTSGIRDNWSQMPYADGDATVDLGTYLEGYLVEGGDWYSAADNYYDYLPGTTFHYGNIATALAGYVVESATDTGFDDYCEGAIFDVLNMDHTGWHLEDFDPTVVAMPYAYTGGQHQAVGHYGYPDYPDGQLRSSVSDMARFLAAVSNEGQLGEAALLSPEATESMLSPVFPEVDSGQCVFWYESTLVGRPVIGHNGSDQGVATQIGFSPESGIGVVFLINTTWDVAGDAPNAIMDALFQHAETHPDL